MSYNKCSKILVVAVLCTFVWQSFSSASYWTTTSNDNRQTNSQRLNNVNSFLFKKGASSYNTLKSRQTTATTSSNTSRPVLSSLFRNSQYHYGVNDVQIYDGEHTYIYDQELIDGSNYTNYLRNRSMPQYFDDDTTSAGNRWNTLTTPYYSVNMPTNYQISKYRESSKDSLLVLKSSNSNNTITVQTFAVSHSLTMLEGYDYDTSNSLYFGLVGDQLVVITSTQSSRESNWILDHITLK